MGYYEFILIIVLVNGYIVAIKKKSPPYFPNGSGLFPCNVKE